MKNLNQDIKKYVKRFNLQITFGRKNIAEIFSTEIEFLPQNIKVLIHYGGSSVFFVRYDESLIRFGYEDLNEDPGSLYETTLEELLSFGEPRKHL